MFTLPLRVGVEKWETPKGGVMRLRIDAARCVGHGLRYMRAPQLIEPDESGYGKVRDEESDVPEEYVESARKAQLSCPEDAVILTPN